MDLRSRLARLDGLTRKPEPSARVKAPGPGDALAGLGLVETGGGLPTAVVLASACRDHARAHQGAGFAWRAVGAQRGGR